MRSYKANATGPVLCVQLMLGVLSATALAPAQTTYYVRPCGDDAWTATNEMCEAPDGPKRTIQAAIDAAQTGDVVVLLRGNRHSECEVFTGPGNKNLDFRGKAIIVRGEFLGRNPCIGIDCEGDGRAFWFHSGETELAVVESLMIRNGFADNGGAVLCESGSGPTLINCAFESNAALTHGGAVKIAPDSSTILVACDFRNNGAFAGGAVHVERGASSLIDCRFESNRADFGGGGIFIDGLGASTRISGCTFVANVADGVEQWYYPAGGAIEVATYATPTVERSAFFGNRSLYGGAIEVVSSNPLIIECLFVGNRAVNRPPDTAAGGAVEADSLAGPILLGCSFSSNSSDGWGGAVASWYGSTPWLSNCVFWGNSAPIGHELALYEYFTNDPPTSLTILYSDVEGGPTDVHVAQGSVLNWGPGNLNADPLFARNPNSGSDGRWGTDDDDYGDLRLTVNSPCIDEGDTEFAPPPGGELDLAGRLRIWDGDSNGSRVIDMGAYEFGAPIPGDVDGDCRVGLSDLATLLSRFGTPSGATYADGDLDFDGDVDLSDLAGLLADFGTTCP